MSVFVPGSHVCSLGILLNFPKFMTGSQQPWLERNLSTETGQAFLTMSSVVLSNIAFLVPQEDKDHFNFKYLA